eukprot:4780963-Karenia_brevis.AAC.1
MEIVAPKEVQHKEFKDIKEVQELNMDMRTPTIMWMLLKLAIWPHIKGFKPMQVIAPPGNLSRKVQAW